MTSHLANQTAMRSKAGGDASSDAPIAQDPEPDSPVLSDMMADTGIEVSVEDEGWLKIGPCGDLCGDAARDVLRHVQTDLTGLTILLTNDAALQSMNKQFRGLDKPTNVLSFAAAEIGGAEGYAGDIAIALETVMAEAADQGKSAADHLSHMVVHGTLHLLGYDHETDEEAEEMERLEVSILARLGVANPYRMDAS